ncbi:hypothetical protein [Paenibacillus sp. GCM10027626]|uniref:RNA dependent RNA polymerase n=1 Tax=Paenibacillus sp. GCM10027626 TaxID=3273411 RepID=UPI00362F470E
MSASRQLQRFVFKFHSSRIREAGWQLQLTLEEAIARDELIALADSTLLRFIRQIQHKEQSREQEIERRAARLRHALDAEKDRSPAPDRQASYLQLYQLLFVPEYAAIVMDTMKDFDRLNLKKGFMINGKLFRRLLATPGGAKNSTVIYVSEDVYEPLAKRLDNGRNPQQPFIPAKLEAYKALACSSSIPVPDPEGVLVVPDCWTSFKTNIIRISDSDGDNPTLSYEQQAEVALNESDGYGLIHPDLSLQWSRSLGAAYRSSGFCIRNAFAKGMVFTFDFIDFADKVAGHYIVKDAWGCERDIRRVRLILTTSMLKLWDSYRSLEHYTACCRENGYKYSVTKLLPEKLEHERNLNYQFFQSFDLSDEELAELARPTIEEIKACLGGDWRMSLLFLKGTRLHLDGFQRMDPDYAKALMIEPRMIDDPFVREKIHYAIKKRINDAKIGVLKVRGNFSTVSGDPYSLCQSIFGMEVTGLLRAGQFYAEYWQDRQVNQIACFRAPMTCHNNIRLLNLVHNEEMRYWYRYMKTVTIFNSWDTTAHALNGCDKDGDAVLTTDNPILLRNLRPLDAIICQQRSSGKIIPAEQHFIKANKSAFGDAIGSITNVITSMFDVRARFSPGSEAFEEMQYRIMCGQHFQQNAIDKLKGIVSKPMPKHWYDYRSAAPEDDNEQQEQQQQLAADKQPYFFIYIYPQLMRKFKSFIKNAEENCLVNFKLTLAELQDKPARTPEEESFLHYFQLTSPVSMSPSTMNRLCRHIEAVFQHDRLPATAAGAAFDYSLLQSGRVIDPCRMEAIKHLYEQYLQQTKEFAKKSSYERIDKEERSQKRKLFASIFQQKALALCPDREQLADIAVELCYPKNSSSKQFAWDLCGEQMLLNLLRHAGGRIFIPERAEDGDLFYHGESFKLNTYYLQAEELFDENRNE